MAAEMLTEAGVTVHLFDAMPSIGRKFSLVGKGDQELTHSEGANTFAGRYRARRQATSAARASLSRRPPASKAA